ncbi:MAG: TonB-dependent receptor plug domain-containing protein [Salinivirgaceae bacterium]|jgi:outer membrane receptor for ferrienterochelin and colicin|nr:TonB-dependent receptor plug domain-containing protein [Salinivirgaceae bacterium]
MKRVILLSISIVLFFTINGIAQSDDIEQTAMFEMSLEELMNIEVSVAGKNAVSNIRETPGAISTISRREIQLSGAYDLMEVLQRLVPGLAFGTDVEGVTGIGVRGIWAHEGKVLLMINGISMNDEQFATTQYGNHINADMIEKIEIIRGPGSSVYGGYAEMGVINVITSEEENEGRISHASSIAQSGMVRENYSASAGITHNDLQISINASLNKGNRSDAVYRDFTGRDTSFLNSNEINSVYLGANINYQGLQVSMLMDKYEISTMDLWGAHSPVAFNEKWDTYGANMSYDFEFGDLKITPYTKVKYQLPWNTQMVAEEYINNKNAQKLTTGVVLQYKLSDQISFTAGTEGYEHNLMLPDDISDYEEVFRSGKDVMTISSIGAFAQSTLKTQIANVMAGVRYDRFSEFGDAFVPRLAVTKIIGNFHMKGMASGSFRIPGGIIPNRTFDVNTKIEPEKVWSYELEAGLRFSENNFLTVNGFYHDLRNVIVYQTEGAIGFYGNGGRLGTAGVEAAYRYVTRLLNLNINYAYYKPMGSLENDYIVPQKDNYYLGFANHRVNANASLRIQDNAYFNLAMRFYGNRYGIVGDGLIAKSDDGLYLDANFVLDRFLVQNLSTSFGIQNLSDNRFIYYQAYNGGHAGLPSLGRTLMVKVEYRF